MTGHSNQPRTPAPGLRRRDVLRLAAFSVAGGALAATRPGGARAGSAAPQPATSGAAPTIGAASIAPVGFWAGGVLRAEDTAESPLGLASRNHVEVIDAAFPSAGDARFLERGARVSFRGVYPREQLAQYYDDLAFDVLFTPFHDTPVHAWSFRGGTVPLFSNANSLFVPIAAEGFSLRIEAVLPGGERRASLASFGPGRSAGAKLMEGVYVVALPGREPAHAWHGVEFRGNSVGRLGNEPFLYQPGTQDLADFPYALVKIELGPVSA